MDFILSGTAKYTDSYMKTAYENKQKEAQIKRKYGFKDKDHVTVYTLPKGQRGKKYGNFSYTPLSAKARRLQDHTYLLKGKIIAMENADLPPKERAEKLHSLRCQLKYTSCKLNAEMGSLPKVGVIVLEEGEE